MAKPFWLEGIREFQIFDVPDDAAELSEQLGTKFKFWFKHNDGKDYLFKQARENTGEHWSEKIACEAASLLGAPSANYDLARWRGGRGVITPMFVAENGRLVHGNELLCMIDGDYDRNNIYHNRYHTVKIVMRFLSSNTAAILPPLEMPSVDGLTTAADAFIGYLLLDAWVGNTDRHHENWGISISVQDGIRLAPSYDHASCLGRIEGDDKKLVILSTSDMGRNIFGYTRRARSALFKDASDKKALNPVDAFAEAARYRPSAAKFWLNRLVAVKDDIDFVVDLIPASEMSEISKYFAKKLMSVNCDRIISALRDL